MYLTPIQQISSVSGTTSTGTLIALGLDYTVNRVCINNDGTVPVRVVFDSTTGSTGGLEIKAGESKNFDVTTYKMAVLTTSTSTGGDDHRAVRLIALGG